MTSQKAWYLFFAMMETVLLTLNLRAERQTVLTYQMSFYFEDKIRISRECLSLRKYLVSVWHALFEILLLKSTDIK